MLHIPLWHQEVALLWYRTTSTTMAVSRQPSEELVPCHTSLKPRLLRASDHSKQFQTSVLCYPKVTGQSNSNLLRLLLIRILPAQLSRLLKSNLEDTLH